MGRNIPSITFRLEARFGEWGRFASFLRPAEREAFRRLMAVVKDRRTAIDAADEDLDCAILLAMTVHLEEELEALRAAVRAGRAWEACRGES